MRATRQRHEDIGAGGGRHDDGLGHDRRRRWAFADHGAHVTVAHEEGAKKRRAGIAYIASLDEAALVLGEDGSAHSACAQERDDGAHGHLGAGRRHLRDVRGRHVPWVTFGLRKRGARSEDEHSQRLERGRVGDGIRAAHRFGNRAYVRRDELCEAWAVLDDVPDEVITHAGQQRELLGQQQQDAAGRAVLGLGAEDRVEHADGAELTHLLAERSAPNRLEGNDVDWENLRRGHRLVRSDLADFDVRALGRHLAEAASAAAPLGQRCEVGRHGASEKRNCAA